MKTTEQVKELITTNDQFLELAVILLHNQQTKDEQEDKSTNHNNNKGFNGGDAKFLSGLAEKIKDEKSLWPSEYIKARKRIIKYVKQITILYNERNP